MMQYVSVSIGGWQGNEEDSRTCRNRNQVEDNNHVRGHLVLISSTFTHIQTKMNRNGKRTGLEISTTKTKLMGIKTKNTNAFVADGQEIEDVTALTI